MRVKQKTLDCYHSVCHRCAQRRRAVPRERENAGSTPWLTHCHHFHAHSQTLVCARQWGWRENESATFCMFKLNVRLFVVSKLFKHYVSAEKGRALSKWAADFHGFRPQQSDRDEPQNEEALQRWLTTHQWEVKLLPSCGRCSRLWNKGSSVCSRASRMESNLARLFVFCRSCRPPGPPYPQHTHPENVLLAPVLSQPETWQVVTVQRRVIHSKHTTGSGDWKSQ